MKPKAILPEAVGPEHCGKKVLMYNRNYDYHFEREVQMVITAPKGRLVIFNTPEEDIKSEAIKAFMEMHRDG